MTLDEYKRFVEAAMHEATRGWYTIHQPKEERCVNPEFQPTPKQKQLEKVRMLQHTSDKHGTLFIVQSLTGVANYVPLADADGNMLLLEDRKEADRAFQLCRKMRLQFDGSLYGSPGGNQ